MFNQINLTSVVEQKSCTMIDLDPCTFCDYGIFDNDGCWKCDGEIGDLID